MKSPPDFRRLHLGVGRRRSICRGMIGHMQIEVINVGDGASSAFSCDSHKSLTLIDCGALLAGARGCAETTAKQLGARLRLLDTIVVTHFDMDHWGGLLDLARLFGALPGHAREVTLHYPGMPVEWTSQLTAGVLALISTKENQPLNAITVVDKWNALPDVTMRAEPLYRGDEFWANGHRWMVHWPPRNIQGTLRGTIERWLDALLDLADELHDAGSPLLRRNLREAYELTSRVPQRQDERSDEIPVDVSGPDDDELGVSAEEGYAQEIRSIPDAFRERFRNLARRMSQLDNYLSLVVEDVEGGFIGFGDVEGRALDALLALTTHPRLASRYSVMLAPHHGTHRAPPGLPSASVCIAQNGKLHSPRHHLHKRTHIDSLCLSTWEDRNAVVVRLA